MHATAIGVPPLVPTQLMEGIGILRFLSISLDSAAFTKPTGSPIIRAGLKPFSISLQAMIRAEGAFPIAIMLPSSCFLAAKKPADVRVIPYLLAISEF